MLKSKVIWITGASSGLGEALAYALANEGAKLILSARRKDELERVKGNCSHAAQPDIRILPLDLTQAETLKLSTSAAIQMFGHIDIVIHNGGLRQRGLAKDTIPEVDRRIMEVNYFGPVALTKYLLPHFLQRKQGHIVVISSLTGVFGTPYRSSYAASKHALHGFFDSLRAELWKDVKHAIPVSIICPGFIHNSAPRSVLTADGSPLSHTDEGKYKGRPVEWFAEKVLHAIKKKKQEVYIGGTETLGVRFKHLFPIWFARYIRKARVR